jgi:hypothetical protein
VDDSLTSWVLPPLIEQVAGDQAGFGGCREQGKPGHVDVLLLALCWYLRYAGSESA